MACMGSTVLRSEASRNLMVWVPVSLEGAWSDVEGVGDGRGGTLGQSGSLGGDKMVASRRCHKMAVGDKMAVVDGMLEKEG